MPGEHLAHAHTGFSTSLFCAGSVKITASISSKYYQVLVCSSVFYRSHLRCPAEQSSSNVSNVSPLLLADLLPSVLSLLTVRKTAFGRFSATV